MAVCKYVRHHSLCLCGLFVCMWFVCACCSYVIKELIQTEKLYVEDLAQIVLVCINCYFVSHS